MRSAAPHEQNVAVRLPSWDEVWKGAAVALILFLFFVGGVTSRQVFVEGDALRDALGYAIPASAILTLVIMACALGWAWASNDDPPDQ